MDLSMVRAVAEHGSVYVNTPSIKAESTSLWDRIMRRLFGQKKIVQLDKDIYTQYSGKLGLPNVIKYRSNNQSVYVKHVFIEHMRSIIKPKITSNDINFFRTLDKVAMRCYVLVYVRNPYTKSYDQAFFLDDFEAIQGIKSEEAARRLVDLSQAAQIIRNKLL
ncbi:hypothetical protein HG263_04955 [Pseudoalteromonas sp. JBTF-M23]|uniref:Uncharacterized protein n=1 Tax=Pseudoalteromonas caenipelagi TaxID=2726988 RepID=A0A849VD86_9GAMM|nr:hypothetical protein [Pseudoalteromonas caenipelagi]NOU49884.1 hypothetical protein [Pseudoalteromonas caenipelagi]